MKQRFLGCIVFALACTAGCNKPAVSTFHGKVSYDGKPVTSGVIYFLGPAPKMQMGMGTIHDDGTYSATDVPVGEVRVSFQAPGLPKEYSDPNTSALVYTITPSTSELNIEIPKAPEPKQ